LPSPSGTSSLSLRPSPPRSTLFPYTTLFRSPHGVYHSARPSASSNVVTGARRSPASRRRWAPSVPTRSPIGVGARQVAAGPSTRSEEHTSELQSRVDLVCRLLLEKKNTTTSK